MVSTTPWISAEDGFKVALAEAGRRPGTRRTHLAYIRRFAAESGAIQPWAVEPTQMTEWLEARSWGPDTRLSAIAALRSFYGWGHRSGLCPWNPAIEAFPPSTGNARVTRGQDLPDAWVFPLERFAAYLAAAGRRPQTIRQHRVHLGAFARKHPDPAVVTEDECLIYLGNPRWSPETRKSARSHLRTFYAWASTRGGLHGDPTALLPGIRVPSGAPHPVPTDIFDGAIDRADDKQRLMLMLGAYAGLRRAEIAQVHPARDITEGMLRVHGKGGKTRLVPLHPLLLAEIDAELDRRRRGQVGTGYRYRNAVTAEGYLFPGQQPGSCTTPYAIGSAVSVLLGEHYTTHGLRHRFASRAYAGTRDIRAVQELMGHSKPETTARYTAVPDGALRAAVMSL